MTHIYKVTGMTCGSCEAKVRGSLLMLPNVSEVQVSKDNQSATITMDKHIALPTLQTALDKKYSITAIDHNETVEQAKGWLATYKPILLIFGYITTISLITATQEGQFNWMKGMNIFMAGFFLTFSFFKMLDIKGFAESYGMYDVVAKKIPVWGFAYPFVEFALGISFAVGFQPIIINFVTLIVMTVSIIGVLQSVFNKRKIKCACLGAVFNIPMSTVTIVEDGLMIVMSVGMLIAML